MPTIVESAPSKALVDPVSPGSASALCQQTIERCMLAKITPATAGFWGGREVTTALALLLPAYMMCG